MKRKFKIKGHFWTYSDARKGFAFLCNCPEYIINSFKNKNIDENVFSLIGTEENIRKILAYLSIECDFKIHKIKKGRRVKNEFE